MDIIKDFLQFMWDVLNNWTGDVTGGLMIAVITAWLIWKDKTMTPIQQGGLIGG